MEKLKNLTKFKYTQSWIISVKGKQENYFNRYLETLDSVLNQFDFETKDNFTNIEFQKKFRSTTNYGDNIREAMKVIRKGKLN